MPRRKRPLDRRTQALASEAIAFRDEIGSIVGERTDDAFRRLSDASRHQLIDDLVHAVGFAKAGLPSILRGKRVRPAAWTLDIFVGDVCKALRKVGVPVLMNQDPALSHAQSLAKDIANTIGLPGARGRLFKQMQRARDIERTPWPDVTIIFSCIISWPDAEWRVTPG